MEKHLLGRVTALFSKIFLACFTWVFTHIGQYGRSGSISNFTKVFVIFASAMMVNISLAGALDLPNWAMVTGVCLQMLCALLAINLVKGAHGTWFYYPQYEDNRRGQWKKLIRITCGERIARGTTTRVVIVLMIPAIVIPIGAYYWFYSLVIMAGLVVVALILLSVHVAERALQERSRKIHHEQDLAERRQQQELDNQAKLNAYPALLVDRDKLVAQRLRTAESLIRAKILVSSSRQEAKSKMLASARQVIDEAIGELKLTETEHSLIMCRVCAELGVVPEQQTSATVAN